MALAWTLVAACLLASSAVPQSTDSPGYRLPRSVVPERYQLYLVPFHPQQFAFTGNVTISVTAAEVTDNITLHANYLQVTRTVVRTTTAPVRELGVVSTQFSGDTRNLLVLRLNENLARGARYELVFEFTGELRDDMYGFYRSSYTADNQTRMLAATQFESTHARRAFPCFDEPAFKATFKINIARTSNMTALSNMPLASTSLPDASLGNRVWDSFNETVKMSTYLVAFVVADFRSLSNGSFATWARPEAVSLGAYSQLVGPQSLEVLKNYTGIAYALPKLDQVALPDFAAGAMENWGLVTYRETNLLYDNSSSTTANKQSIAAVVAHELTHQWFGNLVTMEWWRYTWLNEGFARFFQYYIVDKIEATWRMMDQLLLVQQSVFETDSLAAAASLDSDCNTPGEISAKFGVISYNKGASVIRMMQNALTEDTFRKGIQTYLNSRRFDTAAPSHLYAALQTHAAADGRLPGNSTVEGMFGRWASQAGYPVLRVDRHYDNGSATVSQMRFFLTNGTVARERWSVPLSWTSQSNAPAGFANTTPSAWILDSQSSIQLQQVAASDDWVIFNNQESGYYRVNYDEENWRRIAAHLGGDGHQSIHVLNRAQLLDDSLNLARAGLLDYKLALDVTRYLSRETDYLPWTSALNNLAFIDRRLVGSEAHGSFKSYVLGLLRPLYDSVGFEEGAGDPHVTVLTRGHALTWTCRLGLDDCVRRARDSFGAWANSTRPAETTISANLKSVVYCTAVANGGEKEWNFLWERYTNAELAAEKALILTALGCSKTTSTLNSYLQKSITENSGIRKQDAASVYSAVYSNMEGIDVALDFLVQHFGNISRYYGGMSAVSNSLTGIASRLTTEQQVMKLEEFVTQNEALLDSAATAGKSAVETARANLKWKNGNYETIQEWLRKNTPVPTSAANYRFTLTTTSLLCVLVCAIM
ncbi:aminopeptidase N-like [Bacillus rossius redtenbacheri]|uniref:aminopeptidase N-like n=1 Tax=Bacillus rossius redtenbacheri TaxID=93214 RepID=UPI002FDC9190